MSFSKDKREKIKKYILEKIENNQDDVAKRTAEAYEISLNTVYRYIRELESEKIICKASGKYGLNETMDIKLLERGKNEIKDEDIIYEKYIHKYLKGFSDNVKKIWQYSFMEMMNNAIDHSEADTVFLMVVQNYMSTTILIKDNGIGIFRKIKEYYNYNSLDDAVSELFKGKLTTDSERHSGEGIFFTSRILDRFAAISDGKVFTHDKYSELLQDLEENSELRKLMKDQGTIIFMQLSNFSNKILKEVFDMFADVDGGFVKTQIPIKNIFETYPVSRSQAKRLCNRFENFEVVELDFSEVEEIGQGFAHEVFVVFQNSHPEIQLLAINTCPEVEKMIHHVKKTKK